MLQFVGGSATSADPPIFLSLVTTAPYAAGRAPPATWMLPASLHGAGMHPGQTVDATRRATSWRLVVVALLLSGAAFACVVSDAFTGPEAGRVELRFTGDTLLIVGDTAAFGFTVEIGGSPLANPRLSYTIDDSTVVSWTAARDSLIARRRGRTNLTAVFSNSLLSTPPSLTIPLDVVVASVAVTPAIDTLTSLDDTLILAAPAYDLHGSVVPGATALWTSSDTGVAAFVAPGRLVARANGQVSVQAAVDNETATASIVVAQRLVRLQVLPAALQLTALTAETTVVANALDARGHVLAGVPVSWTSDAPSIATVASDGRVRALDNGTARLRAQSGSVQDTLSVLVEQLAEQVVIVPDPVPAIVALGDQVSLAATATDELGFLVTVPNKTPGWATLDPTIATVDRNGLITGVGVGTARIVAVLDAARDTVNVAVGDLPASIVIQPSGAALTSLNDTVLLAATVRNNRGNIIQNPAIGWRSSDPAIARVDTVPSPLAVAVGVGVVRVIATAGSVADTALVTITNAPVSINITSQADTLTSIWDSLALPVLILNARGDTLPRTAVTWTSDAPLIGSVTTTGLVVARDTGQTMVRAKYGTAPGDTIRDSIGIRVFNLPASIVLSDSRDTMTAIGQALAYTGLVRNARGNEIPGYPLSWSSTSPAVVTVSASGVATAAGYGSAFVISQAGGAADSVVDVVVNPTRLIVDNATLTSPRFGTLERPYARIQEGLNAAEVDDTVFVRKGATSYSETVALTRRVTLLGDDSAFVASVPRNPLLLPLISHDTGAAGITAYTAATVVVKNLALRHTTAGPAIDARRADLRIAGFFVNPPGTVTGRIGRGIALDSASSASATITGVDIRSVRGYGIRVRDGQSVAIDSVYIELVDSLAGVDVGAGIRILRGSGNTVRHATIRGTQGPAILIDSTSSVIVASNDVAGRQRLVLVRATTTATIQSNQFDSRPLGLNGEVFSGGTLLEWAALELSSSWQAIVASNTFRDVANQEPFNAMRFVAVKNPSFPSQPGAQVLNNSILGTRAGVRSQGSNLTIQGSRFDSTMVGVIGTGNDTWTLLNDTITTTLQGACVRATSATSVTLTASWFEHCTARSPHAVATAGGTVRVQQSTFVDNRAAIGSSGTSVTAIGNSIDGAGFNPLPGDTLVAEAAIEAVAPTVAIVQNTVTGHSFNAGVRVQGGQASAQMDSNFISTNATGVRLGSLGNFSAVDNDIFDNVASGVVNEVTSTESLPQTWWGDGRGPRGSADPAATGDSLIGNVNPSGWSTTPHASGSPATASRIVRGNGQTAPRGTVLPKAFTVRVVDAAGRPVAGVQVTFRVGIGGGSIGGTVRVDTNASGLAEVTLTLGPNPGPNTVTAAVTGLPTLTFTASGT